MLSFTDVLAATYTINFDAARDNELCFYGASVGDTLKFKWEEQHNLYEFPDNDLEAYRNCDFGGATKHADAGPNKNGKHVSVDHEENELFWCSKICDSADHKVRVCIGDQSCMGNSGCAELKEGQSNAASARFGLNFARGRGGGDGASALKRVQWDTVFFFRTLVIALGAALAFSVSFTAGAVLGA